MPLLQLRAVAPDDDDDDDEAADGQPSRNTLLAVLSRLNQQCSIFKQSAEQLADGVDNEDIQVTAASMQHSVKCLCCWHVKFSCHLCLQSRHSCFGMCMTSCMCTKGSIALCFKVRHPVSIHMVSPLAT